MAAISNLQPLPAAESTSAATIPAVDEPSNPQSHVVLDLASTH